MENPRGESHRVREQKVPDGTDQETKDGARTGRAAREMKCHDFGSSGGAAVRMPTLTSTGKDRVSRTGARTAGRSSGVGIVNRVCSARY